jgi:NAD-dependent dihydropyrimidine dehydrogenase PreA subunit
VTYVIALPCVDVKDQACVDECPVDCIYEGARSLYIQPDECVDCGACEPVCPTSAIFFQDDLPPEWAVFEQINAQFFSRVGAPGGASRVGPLPYDPPAVASLPAQG